MIRHVDGTLLLYHHLLTPNAATISEHSGAFRQYSRYPTWELNTELGFPAGLWDLEFDAIILHYSLFGMVPYRLNGEFIRYLEQARSSFKVAFFQDEYHYCKHRFEFLNHHHIDCVFTLVEPQHYEDTYRKHTRVPVLVTCLPGYVSPRLVERAESLYQPDSRRRIDIGYRGRRLPLYMGRGAREKTEIAARFNEMARDSGLRLDIEVDEKKRLYGRNWYRFLADCRAVLGVEAGVSVFDIEDTVRAEYERLITDNPQTIFNGEFDQFLSSHEDGIFYRTISPRHFEAAAFRNCQILYEGKYSGILKPMLHYIPLRKDWSNFDNVLRSFRDESIRHELTENAHRDLIASGQYHYRQHIRDFDEVLRQAGLKPGDGRDNLSEVTAALQRGLVGRKARAIFHTMRDYPFPGRANLVRLTSPLLSALRISKRSNKVKE